MHSYVPRVPWSTFVYDKANYRFGKLAVHFFVDIVSQAGYSCFSDRCRRLFIKRVLLRMFINHATIWRIPNKMKNQMWRQLETWCIAVHSMNISESSPFTRTVILFHSDFLVHNVIPSKLEVDIHLLAVPSPGKYECVALCLRTFTLASYVASVASSLSLQNLLSTLYGISYWTSTARAGARTKLYQDIFRSTSTRSYPYFLYIYANSAFVDM
jgi:hypothetical protein